MMFKRKKLLGLDSLVTLYYLLLTAFKKSFKKLNVFNALTNPYRNIFIYIYIYTVKKQKFLINSDVIYSIPK